MVGRLQISACVLLNFIYKEMYMRTKIMTVLFFLLIVSTFAVAQNTSSGGTSGAGSTSSGSSSGTSAGASDNNSGAAGNSGSFLNPSSRGVQVPPTSGIGNVTVNPTTPGTFMFDSQNLNSPTAIDSSSGTPTIDEIVAAQSDLISSTNSFLNPTTDSTSNTRTSNSVLGETIFGNTIVPGMTNVPIVNVVPSTNPLIIGTTTTNPNSNPQ
jgi:hypothetical protein